MLMSSNLSYQRDIRVMGIVNLTDDSFYSGSRFLSSEGFPELERIAVNVSAMKEDGADIIDFGACSTRPGSVQCGPETEWQRLEPVLDLVAGSMGNVAISIDTVWSEVVEKAWLKLGRDFIVNDVSLSSLDPKLLPLTAEIGLKYVAMHNGGASEQRLSYPYGVTVAVHAFFEEFADRAARLGLDKWIIDPGFGFSKTMDDNWELLMNMETLRTLGCPVLAGVSRKSFIYKLIDQQPFDCLASTQLAQLLALQHGADMLRVHDVKDAVETVRIYRKSEEMMK